MYIFGIVICPFFFLGWNLFQFLYSIYEFWYTVFICVFWHFNEFKKLDCELDVFSFILSDQKRSVMVPCTSVLWFPLMVSVYFFFFFVDILRCRFFCSDLVWQLLWKLLAVGHQSFHLILLVVYFLWITKKLLHCNSAF